MALASRIATELGQPCDVEGIASRSAPAWVSLFIRKTAVAAEELLQRADAAMYAAKHDANGPTLYSQIDPVTLRQPTSG